MENTLRFNVEGMTCGGCVRTVRQALDSVPGITAGHVVIGEPVEVRLDSARADRAAVAAAVAAAVEQAGYRPVFTDAG